MGQVTIEIAGRTYRMACEDGEEDRLVALGEQFDATIKGLRQSFGEIGDRRLIVMAGMMATDDLAGVRARVEGLSRENAELKARIASLEGTAALDTGIAPRLLEMAEQIDHLAHTLNDTVKTDMVANTVAPGETARNETAKTVTMKAAT